jgi:glutathione S-transferase
MITVYSTPSTRGTRITWLLEELQQEYQYHLIDFAKGDSKSAEFLAINPAGKVPAIKDDDLVMTESGAIVTYLADKFSEAGLIPPTGTSARGSYEQWSYFTLCELEQPLWTIGKHKFALPKEQRVKEIFPTAAWELQKALQLFSDGLGDKEYMVENRFTAVDILLAHTLIWATSFEQPIEQLNLQAYLQRLTARSALQKARQRENASLG